MDLHAVPLGFQFLFLLLTAWFLYAILKKTQGGKTNLPPGPPGLPIIGNLHQLGKLPHQSFWQLSNKYGPVMLLKMGRVPVVVITSPDAAKEVLQTNDLACCSRPLTAGSGRLSYNYLDVAFAPYGDNWRNMRKLIILELFSLKRVQSFRYVREEEVGLVIDSISKHASDPNNNHDSAVNLTEKLFALSANITFRMSFGFCYRGTNFDKDGFHKAVHATAAVIGSLGMEECFPIQFIGRTIDRISGRHAWIERVFRELDNFFEHVINDHIKAGSGSCRKERDQEDMIDVLLGIEKEQAEIGSSHRFTKDNIKSVLLDLFLGGIDTSALTTNWAMAELAKNPRIMKKVQEEVRNTVGNKRRVTESDIDQLEYLQLVIKETLRLHPPAPLLVPRETMSHCKINGYDIYPKTLVHVNTWAIARDPKYWKDPEVFLPERFMDSSMDYKGQHFQYLPFGGGRRFCAGIHMGTITVGIMLANLLYCFDWKLPDGMKPEELDMEEEAGVSLTVSKKGDLCLVPVNHRF